ncbi:sodium ion-translocating decarboxylase, beta subunit [Alkaliphilus metalliredigens QYMF]|uniref:Sodium ion-translocating decarboxylase, beta subunit n=1 Tax=Alkaliphilus metalliredigens (strain QYMF) TaxID=293826 RepID=A6TT36_ALKMQ|nr:sodium ion-translocating decarboxylase subunit beta [Alkaliphilus metalliredigens]ABR49354.1 sodium ion-translocating decarboxylase, beta subunit [Alkaliphilus metalliredigens QYMF]ABR50607.1 sodium ion-translocating decarboxylase, beta subunit [Alkaliphilus metalliredigens QYMF]
MLDVVMKFWETTGYANITWQALVMMGVACVLLYLAIGKGFEPLLLVPIAFGMLLTNLPQSGVMELGHTVLRALTPGTVGETVQMLAEPTAEMLREGIPAQIYTETPGGLLQYFYRGNQLGIFPPLIFLGVGAMTDFGPLIANPKSLFLGAAAQLGIFFTFTGAILMGFTAQESSAIGIIGGADGPTAILITAIMASHLLGPIAVAAYSYMALVPIIQPPIMKALTTKEERMIRMKQLRNVSKKEKIIFPILVTILVSLLLPAATPLIGMLMFGNLLKESLVTDRLSKTAQNELINIVTILLGLSVGASARAEEFLQITTIQIIVLGMVAFAVGSATGVILAKFMNKLMGGNAINPLIGSAGVSAVPMAARVSQTMGQKEDPTNFLLMHAMGPNVAGVIGSAVAAGVLLSLFN